MLFTLIKMMRKLLLFFYFQEVKPRRENPSLGYTKGLILLKRIFNEMIKSCYAKAKENVHISQALHIEAFSWVHQEAYSGTTHLQIRS